MANREDRRAAVMLLALAVAGVLVRVVTGDTAPPGAVAYRPASGDRPSLDSVAARAARLMRPLGVDETIDVDRAHAEELARLPGVGPGLAARIVADREEHGAFGTLDGLGRVAGIGPRTLERLRRHVRFTGVARTAGGSAERRVRLNTATATELETLPGVGPVLAAAIVADRARHGPYRRLEDLTRVRGVGDRTIEGLRGRILVP